MKISVIGSESLGLLAAANFAARGHDVLCAGFGASDRPLVDRGGFAKVRFTGSRVVAARHGQLVFIAFGTPGAGVGRAWPLNDLLAAAIEVAENLQGPAIVINEGTVAPAAVGYVAQRMVEHTKHPIVVVPNCSSRRQHSSRDAWPKREVEFAVNHLIATLRPKSSRRVPSRAFASGRQSSR